MQFFKKIIIALSLVTSAHSVFSQEVSSEDMTLSENEKKELQRTVESHRVNDLKKLYEEQSERNSARFDRSYLLGEPMTMDETVDFRHPYWDFKISELTEGDMENIKRSIQEQQDKEMRYRGIMGTAMKYAMDAALYKTTREYHAKLRGERFADLNNTFPFFMLTLDNGNVRPPTIMEVGYQERIENQRLKRKIKGRFLIKRQAEVITQPQTFLLYFDNMIMPQPKPPSIYLLPVTEEEKKYWRKGAINGWVEGHRLAQNIIRENIRNMISEFYGQLQYHFLADRKILTKPTTLNLEIGTNALGNVMNVGESIIEMKELPRFNDNEMDWLVLPSVDDIFGELTDDDVQSLTDELIYFEGLTK